MKVLFLCTGNFYRSRLAEELAHNYAFMEGIGLVSDSAGLGPIPNAVNVGPIRFEVVEYLEKRGIKPRGAGRFPRKCTAADIESSGIVIGMNEAEHRQMVEEQFQGVHLEHVRYWHVPDMEEDPGNIGPDLMYSNVLELLAQIRESISCIIPGPGQVIR